MNSNYKRREQTSSKLNGPNTKDYSCENGENVSSSNKFTRKHQRNLSLPVNNVFQPKMVSTTYLSSLYITCIQQIINLYYLFLVRPS